MNVISDLIQPLGLINGILMPLTRNLKVANEIFSPN